MTRPDLYARESIRLYNKDIPFLERYIRLSMIMSKEPIT